MAAEIEPDAVLLVCKPRPELLSLGRKLARSLPVIVDIDDPELEVGWGTTRLRSRVALVARYGPSRFRFGWAKRVVNRMNVITSSPILQSWYGGESSRTCGKPYPFRLPTIVIQPCSGSASSARLDHTRASRSCGPWRDSRQSGRFGSASPRRLRVMPVLGRNGSAPRPWKRGFDSSTPARGCDRVPPGPVG